MRFWNGISKQAVQEDLTEEYRSARAFGAARIGETYLFFRAGFKTFSIAYGEITRFFRRVLLVPMKVCCGKGEMAVEHLVVCGSEGEVAQIQLPGTREAKILMEELTKRLPGIPNVRP